MLCREDEGDVEQLSATVRDLLGDPGRLQSMADAARTWSRPDAADAILALLTRGN